MQGTCRTSLDMQGVAAASCTLLQQMSQDLLDRAPGELNSGCDSSDCLICQGQRQFCNQAITNTLLGARRASSSTAGTPACSSQLSTVTAPQQSASQQQPQQRRSAQPEEDDQRGQRKRLRVSAALTRVGSTGEAASTATAVDSLPSSSQVEQQLQQEQPHQQHAQQQDLPAPLCSSGSQILQHSSSASWQWQPEFAALDGPAPARFVQAARLQPPADALPGHCPGRCDRISGLEFSPDGQLVAAAGVSKEVALYPLAPLTELQDAAAEPGAALLGCLGSCSSSQRRERMQQSSQQQAVPLLPPVATVRLPGKVSSIAFSPDMQGVISIGDYDGTLTQVHVASGHYLNEVDAHAGRRIWSVCHSKLRRHFAATASDDCTARLWSGSGLNTHVATITAPGRPAVCGADFSSSDEHLLALAAADARVYLYDLRQLQQPLATLHGHRRPVAYAKFFGSQQLVSASIDGTLAVWDLAQVLGRAPSLQDTAGAASTASAAGSAPAASGPSPANSTCCSSDGSCWKQQPQPQQAGSSSGAGEGRCSSTSGSSCCTAAGATAAGSTAAAAAGAGPQSPKQQHQPWKVFRGHTNEKNFVGLAVDPCSGLLAVGSETPEVFSYHTSWSSPLAVYDMASQQSQQQSQQQQEPGSVLQQMQQPTAAHWGAPPPPQQRQQQSVSAVAWQPACCATAARAGCGVGGCAPSTLLAAATSAGACMLLSLQHPS